MAHKKPKYSCKCYYGQKLLGSCTTADADAYTVLMEKCNGNATRVLREYAYFSLELKAILEKAAKLQGDIVKKLITF